SYVTFKRGFNDRKTGVSFVSRWRPSKPLVDLLNCYLETYVKTGRYQQSIDLNQLIAEVEAYASADTQLPDKFIIPLASTIHFHSSDCIRLKNAKKDLIPYADTPETVDMRKR